MKFFPTQSIERSAERLLGRRIGADDVELCVELDDGVKGAVDQAVKLLLATAQRVFRPQARDLGGGAGGEDLDDRQRPGILGHRPRVDHREIADHLPVRVHQGHPR